MLAHRGSRAAIDQKFVEGVRRLVRRGLTDAEIVRELQGLTALVGRPVPSYWTVRRIADTERRRLVRRDVNRERMLEELFAGRIPLV
jgi:hypothetical protein